MGEVATETTPPPDSLEERVAVTTPTSDPLEERVAVTTPTSEPLEERVARVASVASGWLAVCVCS